MTATLVFDIETVPDVVGGRRVLGLDDCSDEAVFAAMQGVAVARRGRDFQPAHLQKVVAISCLLSDGERFHLGSIGDADSSEAELVEKFFAVIDRHQPTLVSWNGGGFDLPVLHYRGLLHGVAAPRYWDTGLFDRDTRYSNYLKRYEFRHTDLMDVLALYTGRHNAPLTEIALLLGFPGKLGMDGSQVFDVWRAGGIADIRAYCETDVLNTYLIYLRFQRFRGLLSSDALDAALTRVRTELKLREQLHWQQFLAAWPA